LGRPGGGDFNLAVNTNARKGDVDKLRWIRTTYPDEYDDIRTYGGHFTTIDWAMSEDRVDVIKWMHDESGEISDHEYEDLCNRYGARAQLQRL
jgi:hypothetical protein